MCFSFLCYQGDRPRTRCFPVGLFSQASGDTASISCFLQLCNTHRVTSLHVYRSAVHTRRRDLVWGGVVMGGGGCYCGSVR